MSDPFQSHAEFTAAGQTYNYARLGRLEELGLVTLSKLPYSIRVLLESLLRNVDGFVVTEDDVRKLCAYDPQNVEQVELPFKPGRVVLQDFTGVPAVVDLAALRSAMVRMGGDPKKINPLVRCDLVVDHSVQVDRFAVANALQLNVEREFERNQERYQFLKWGQQAFDNFGVVPPATGIVHQVNLEHLATLTLERDGVVYPDSLVGTDSHTTMINGIGVVGWGVGGIEAEAVMLGQPIYMLTPEVVGFRLTGGLKEGVTATDLVLTVTQTLRKHGVVGKFVEFCGPGLDSMTLPDRATLANMAPEYGATMGFFPVDEETLAYMRRTGRSDEIVERAENYFKAQHLFRTSGDPEPEFASLLELDLGSVTASLAGPKLPQDRIELTAMQSQWRQDLSATFHKSAPSDDSTPASMTNEGGPAAATATTVASDPGFEGVPVTYNGEEFRLKHGSVVIAAITSCTNTSNPSVMLAAGLLAKKAVEKGLDVKPWVKTSLAPGSRVVTDYLAASGLNVSLDQLGFNLVGYGCTTCIGNSGPLPTEISQAINEHDIVACSVLSGNRNFEGRVSPDVQANYLASPPLVVAYALAGTTDIDLTSEPLGVGSDGQPVHLSDIWPSQQEIGDAIASSLNPEMFRSQYAKSAEGPDEWRAIDTATGDIYEWDESSTYVQEPPFFVDMEAEPGPIMSIEDARVLVKVGDSTTTDHISPAGVIKEDSPAGEYLKANGVEVRDFNSYGSRRGNDRVMTRGTFANIRLRNELAPGTSGGWTTYLPTGEQEWIYDSSLKYKESGTPLIVLAGKEYGTGSSRDWAAKGTLLLGIKAVIAESFERIHRSNLVGMGVLPLQFRETESAESLGLDGSETFDIALEEDLQAGSLVFVTAKKADGEEIRFTTTCRIDTPVEVEYYKNGGILHTVLRQLAKS